MSEVSKVQRFSGREEDFYLWKRRFAGQIAAIKLGYLVNASSSVAEKKQKASYEEDACVLMGYLQTAMPDHLLVKLDTF